MPDVPGQSKHFCILPWIHFQVAPTGEVNACCRASGGADQSYGSLREKPIEEIWNGERARKMRLALLADQPAEACRPCYEREANGAVSERQLAFKQFSRLLDTVRSTGPDGQVDLSKVAYVDLRLS